MSKAKRTDKPFEYGEGFDYADHWRKLYIKADKLARKEMFKRRGAERKIKLLEAKIKAMDAREKV